MQYTYNKNLETLTKFHHQTKNRHNNMCLFYIYLHLNLFLFDELSIQMRQFPMK